MTVFDSDHEPVQPWREITYVLAAEDYDGWAKIGRSECNTALSRRDACQTGNPRRLRLVATWISASEGILHTYYAPVRGVGEWFAFPAAMLADMAQSALKRESVAGIMARWPIERILAAAGGATEPNDIADRFATAHVTTQFSVVSQGQLEAETIGRVGVQKGTPEDTKGQLGTCEPSIKGPHGRSSGERRLDRGMRPQGRFLNFPHTKPHTKKVMYSHVPLLTEAPQNDRRPPPDGEGPYVRRDRTRLSNAPVKNAA